MKQTRPDADVVIVGSGIAGALIADSLARAGVRVIVLEAGPRITRADTAARYRATHRQDLSAAYPNTPLAPRPDLGEPGDDYLIQVGPDRLDCEYLRVVGGTTWHWAGVALRTLPGELRMRSSYGVGVDWPLAYDELEPFYLRSERELGVCGDDSVDYGSPRSGRYPLPPMPPSYLDRRIAAALAPHGIRFDPRPAARNSEAYDGRSQCAGFNSCSPICPTGAQYSADVHVRRAERGGAEVRAETLVTRIEIDDEGAVRALHYRREDGATGQIAARAYVIAANGLETPRLLLLSRSASAPQGVANRSGQVGRNLMDHPGLSFRFLTPEPVFPGRGPESTVNYYGDRDGPFRRHRAGWTLSLYNVLHLHDIVDRLLREGYAPPELDREIRRHALRAVEIDTHLELLPEAENRLTLDDRLVDSSGLPRMRIHYRIGDYTRRGVEQCRSTIRRMLTLLGATDVRDRGVFSHHHLMGTTRMGTDAGASVVDPHGRTHDHHNLYIAGSSVFPTGTTANPTLTIAALALRLAAELEARLGVSDG